jgi:uncharacterized protein
MTANQRTIDRYMEGFRKSDHEMVLSCLSGDVEWELPGAFHIHGKEAFDQHIEDEGFVGSPEITVFRMLEQNDVVVAEGAVRARRTDGTELNLVFCDLFEMRNGEIRKLTSYLMTK